MEIAVPLSHFAGYLAEVVQRERRWPQLKQTEWILDNFKYDNQTATFAPEPAPAPYTARMLKHARN